MSGEKKKKILYIEDDLSSRVLVKKVLERSSFEYFEAASGLEGLKKAKTVKPDLIIMDINLPDITGNELTTKLKNTPDLKNIIIVALTASIEENIREITLLAGCDGFLQKPINVKDFPAQLNHFLEGKKEEIPAGEKDLLHSQYEISLVEHLTGKVQELEESNSKLARTSRRLKSHSEYLEKILQISSKLQLCKTAGELKKSIIREICNAFHYDRCVFFEIDEENMEMKVSDAQGIPLEKWNQYSYPFKNTFFQKLFMEKHVIFVPNLIGIKDKALRKQLEKFEVRQFIFAYLGMSSFQTTSEDIRDNVLPLLTTFLPSLHDQTDADIDIILNRLQEYFSNDSLYRAGFILFDNYRTKRKIASYEYHFLENLFRSASYMYQNLLLLEKLRSLFVRAEKEAITDPLTDLFNYRYFMDQLKREISRNSRHKSHFSLIMIDIDFFKNYNDTFGHQAGDLILKKISHLLTENTRTSDIVARYGGEEFVIVCPELNHQGAVQMAEKLRHIVENTEFIKSADFPKTPLTISLGISTFPGDGETAYQLIRSADKALYKAKGSGRNRVCTLSP